MDKKNIIKVYGKLLKYPMFPLTPGKYVIQHTSNYAVEMQALNPVSVSTEEKFFAILWLIRNKIARVEYQTSKSQEIEKETVLVTFKLRDLSLALNSNDYKNILKELDNLKSTSIKITYPNGSIISFSMINQYFYNKPKGEISVKIEMLLYRLCLTKFLRIDFQTYLALNKAEKNLYKLLISNINLKTISIEKIKERCNIQISSEKNLKNKIKKYLNRFKQLNIVNSFSIQKNKVNFEINLPAT